MVTVGAYDGGPRRRGGVSTWIITSICAMIKSRYIGDGRPPTFNDGILISWVYKPLIGLMSLSPIIWK